IKQLTEKSPKLVIRTILKISMYAIKYLKKHDYAVIKNAVELTKKLGKGGMAGFVNAFLRKFVDFKFEFPKKEDEYISIKYSYPLFAVRELLKKYNKERVENILSYKNEKSTLAFYDINGEQYLKEKDIEYEKTPYDNVFFVKNFTRNEDYDKGLYTFQNIGTVAICDAVPDCENLLDSCSAPGGKSVRLSYKVNNVLALDIHEHRVELIKDYYTRMKRENIIAKVEDASVFNSEYKNKFDVVLCDVPCSGLGVTFDNPDIKLFREENDYLSLQKEQISIITNCSNYVKVGGCLIYSTCSIFDRENIAIIKSFMSNIKGFKIEKIDSKLPCEVVDNTNYYLPDISFGAGFFVCKLKRIK
ncbi:MAG: hypothetical protein KBS91_02340, partial [Firmicutes bacterium]|nr:hypothetical protein [Candidatus Caballimonas caccae]